MSEYASQVTELEKKHSLLLNSIININNDIIKMHNDIKKFNTNLIDRLPYNHRNTFKLQYDIYDDILRFNNDRINRLHKEQQEEMKNLKSDLFIKILYELSLKKN